MLRSRVAKPSGPRGPVTPDLQPWSREQKPVPDADASASFVRAALRHDPCRRRLDASTMRAQLANLPGIAKMLEG